MPPNSSQKLRRSRVKNDGGLERLAAVAGVPTSDTQSPID